MNMCQLHFMMRMNGNLSVRDIKQFCKMMCLGSERNSDAFGLFNSRMCFKQSGKYQPNNLNNVALLNDSFVVGHNRLTTTGDETKNENNHPFELDDFILAHNGVINNQHVLREKYDIPETPETDSYVILWLISHFFQQSQAKTRQKRIVNAIRKTCSQLAGWYSVFLYDRGENNIFYFRNIMADFAFALFEGNLLVGSTAITNLQAIYSQKECLYNDFLDLSQEPSPCTIYLINQRDKIKALAEFKDADKAPSPYDYNCHDADDELWRYEQSVADYLSDCLGYCPEFYLDESGIVYIRLDDNITRYADVMLSNYERENGWIHTPIECIAGIDEYIDRWY